MTLTQTVDIPLDRRLTIEVPRDIPTGRTNIIIQFPVQEAEIEYSNASPDEVNMAGDEILEKHLAAFKALAK